MSLNTVQFVPVYHCQCSGSQRSSDMIDLSCDEENENGVPSSTVALIASDNSTMHGQQSVDSGPAQTLKSLETHFMSLIQDMTSTQSQMQRGASSSVTSLAALPSHEVTQTNSDSASMDYNPVTFMFPAHFSSADTSSTQLTQASITRPAIRQPVLGGAVRTSVSGRIVRTVTPRILGKSVRSTFVSKWRRNESQTQYINYPSTSSVNTSLPQQCTSSQTSRSVSQSASHTSLSSVSSQAPFIPVSTVTSSAIPVHINLNSLTSNLALQPCYVSRIQLPRWSSTDAYRGTVHGVQVQQPQLNYSAFCLQPQQPVTLIVSQVATTATQQQFNITPVCAAHGVNLTSVRLAQPVTFPSQYQLCSLSVTSASSVSNSALPQMQISRSAHRPLASISTLPRMQISRHSVPLSQHTSVNVTWTAGTAGSHMVAGTECTSTSVSQLYASTATDEFVDIESIAAQHIPPIVIAPDNCRDECNRPDEYALGDVRIKEEPLSSVRKSTLRRRHELICIDDDEQGSAAVPTDETSSEFTISDEPTTDDTDFDLEHILPTLLSNYNNIPAINIVPDDSSCSPIQTNDLCASVASSDVDCPLTRSMLDSDTANVEPVTASCTASDSVFPTILPLADASVCVDTKGVSFARSVESTGIISPSFALTSGFVYTSQNTVHHFAQSHVTNSPASASALASYFLGVSPAPVFYTVPTQPVVASCVSIPALLTVVPSVSCVPTSFSSQMIPVNSAPLVTEASSVVRKCDVTAMATQLVSGLRSDAMRRRATSAAKVAVHQSSESGSTSDASQKRHARNLATSLPAKISRRTPSILSRSQSQLQHTTKALAKELARNNVPVTAGMSDDSVGSNMLHQRRGNYMSQFPSSVVSTCFAGFMLTSQSARSQTSLSATASLTSQTSVSASSDSSDTNTKKFTGETVVYHLNEDGSIEIRMQKGSISETSFPRRKQSLQSGGTSGGLDAIVELGCSASQSWCSESFVSDMGKYFNNLKVVKLSGNDSATSRKSLHVPEMDTEKVGKQQVTSDADDVEPDSDSSRDTLSLVIDSIEPSEEEYDHQLATEDEGGDSSGLKIADVYSLSAEAFTDLNDQVVRSIVSDAPHEAQDKEASQQSYSTDDATGDVPCIAVNVSENSDSTKVHNVQQSRTSTITIPETCQRNDNSDNSILSTECHMIPTCRSSSLDGHENNVDLGDEVTPVDNSGDTSLFEISVDNDRDTDSEATITLSVASPESTAEPLSNLVDAESNSQQASAVEQHALLPLGGEIHPARQLSSRRDESDEVVKLPCLVPHDEDYQLSALEVTRPVVPQLSAEPDEAATDESVILNEDEGGNGQLITEMSLNHSCDFEWQDSHVTSCRQQNDACTEKDEVTLTSSNVDRSNDEDMQLQLPINDDVESSLSSLVNTVDKIHNLSGCLTGERIKTVDQNSGPSSASDEIGGTGISEITTENRLHQSDNMTGGREQTSAVLVPETKSRVKCDDVISTELVSPPPEPEVTVSDLSDVEPDDSSSAVAVMLEVTSVSTPVSTREESEAPASRGYSSMPDTPPVPDVILTDVSDVEPDDNSSAVVGRLQLKSCLPDTEPVPPPLAEPAHDTGEHVSQTMTSSPLAKYSQLLELELTESDHSSASRTGSLLRVSGNLESKTMSSHDNQMDTEDALPVLLESDRSESSTRPSDSSGDTSLFEISFYKDTDSEALMPLSTEAPESTAEALSNLHQMYRVTDAEPVTPVAEAACDTDAQIWNVEPDTGSAAVAIQSEQHLEKPSGETKSSDNSMTNMEPVSGTLSEQPCDTDMDLNDVELVSHELRNEKSVSAPESPVTLSPPQNSVCLPVLVAEKSASPRYSDSNVSSTCPVSSVQEPTHDATSVCEPERDKSRRSLNLAHLPSPATEERASAVKHGSDEWSAVKSSSLLVFVTSLSDVRPVSPKWLSDTLDTYAPSVSAHSDVEHFSESHQAGRRTVSVPKVPKRITLADYRSRKSASQVDISDKNCQQVEPNQVVASCETVSKVNSATVPSVVPSESHSAYSSTIASNSDGDVLVDNPVQECSNGNRSHNTDLSSSIAASCDVQQTAVTPHDSSFAADLTASSNGTAKMYHSTGLDALTEEDTNMSNSVDDNPKTTEVDEEFIHEHQSEIGAAIAEAIGVLPAASSADVDKVYLVNQNEERMPLSSGSDEMPTNYVGDSHNTKLSLENSEALSYSVSDVEPSEDTDDHTEAVEIDSSVAQSLTGTDEEILNDVPLNISTANSQERGAGRKKRKAARKPWNSTLIPVDVDDFSECEAATFCRSADVRTLPKHMRYDGYIVALRDHPVTIPTEPLDSSIASPGIESADKVVDSHSSDNASFAVTDGSVKNADASRSASAKEGQLPYRCDKTSLPTDLSQFRSLVSFDTETIHGQDSSRITQVTDNSEVSDALKPDISSDVWSTSCAINKQVIDSSVEDMAVSACTVSAHSNDCCTILSPSSPVVIGMETEFSKSEFEITGGQQIAETSQSSIASLSKIDLNSPESTTTATQSGLIIISAGSLVDINTSTGLVHIPDGQISTVNSEMPLESHAQNWNDFSQVVSTKEDHATFHSEECTGQGSETVVKKDGKHEKKTRLKTDYMKAATMWKNSMRNWVNMDVSKNTDVIVPKYTVTNDFFIARQNASQLMKSVSKLSSRTKVSLEESISTSLKETENLLHEELVYADVATQLDNFEAKLLAEKQLRMTDFLCSVETQLRELSVKLYDMPDAEAELYCYEENDWSTESNLHYNILLLTRHMLYNEMRSLRCYQNSRLVYRLPDEFCLDVEREQFVSVEGSLLFLEDSILSLTECRQLFTLKVEIEEAQYGLAQLNSDFRGSDQANRLGCLHLERRQKLDSISVKSVDSLRTLQTLLTQQLRWYRYVNLVSHLLLIIYQSVSSRGVN